MDNLISVGDGVVNFNFNLILMLLTVCLFVNCVRRIRCRKTACYGRQETNTMRRISRLGNLVLCEMYLKFF